MDEPAGMVARDRGGAPVRYTGSPFDARLGSLAGACSVSTLSPGLSAGQMASLVGFWHRLDGLPWLPHARRALLGAQPQRTHKSRSMHLNLLGRRLEKNRSEE